MRTRCLGSAMVLVALFSIQPRQARANSYVTFAGGPMKNLYVDLIFWGLTCAPGAPTTGCFVQDPDPTKDDRQRVRDAVTRVANWLNGVSEVIPGLEPAVHSYGVSGVMPGMWLTHLKAVASIYLPPNSGHLDDLNFQNERSLARQGFLGPAFDFNGNVASGSGLLTDANRIALVITKGTNKYCISTVSTFGCETVTGYHYGRSGNDLYGGVMMDGNSLSHEIMEAMTDPFPFSGWHGGGGFSGPDEVADECSQSGFFAPLTVDEAFVGPGGSAGQATCQVTIPEQHAPMAAVVYYTAGAQTAFLYYVSPNGHVNRMQWRPGQGPSAPVDVGQPSWNVRAVGKPSVVFFPGEGEYLFVKGSDNGVWMLNNGAWTTLGGQIYGEPKAAFWEWGGAMWLHVAVLGIDDRLYVNGLLHGVSQFGWGQLPTGGTLFAGPPTIGSRAVDELDVFAPAEDGSMRWVAWQGSAWAAPVNLATGIFMGAPSFVLNSNAVLFGVSKYGLYETSWNGSGWYNMSNAAFQLTNPDSYSSYEGSPSVVSSSPSRYDVFSATRNGKLYWYYSNHPTGYFTTWADAAPGTSQFANAPLVTGGVSGDPVAVTRGGGEVEVFYRTTNGALNHMTYNTGGNWMTEQVFSSIGPATIYDPPSPSVGVSTCSPSGFLMHCCPSGYAMVGADPNQNVFKCAPIDNVGGPITVDFNTVRNNMHVCPPGQVMVGLHVGQNLLACQALLPNSVIAERVDTGTQDARPMRTCDAGVPTGAMSGIHVDGNLLSCVSVTQIQ